ncbi:MAG: metallophosphoesterase [Candidatus Krumholzibacteria bacterium]|nr:metallophosphoesterase [Candidatus Krumholzibacteria bacterium]MDP6668293.1 metallophosphoesterase [Candidatus Krumholzibacteria bacterium]MDP7022097.1 metallophosphoesterase [Candidatus Krumholzibacteria bacterium]
MRIILILMVLPLLSQALFFSVEPEVEIQGEELLLRWETSRPVPATRVSFGIEMPDDPWRSPRWRFVLREEGDSLRKRHEVAFPLRRAEYSSNDVKSLADKGGELLARIESWDPKWNSLNYHELRFAYAWQDSQRVLRPALKLGPWIDRVGPDSAWLSWTLDRKSPVEVVWGPEGGSTERLRLPSSRSMELELSGLKPDQLYEYRILLPGDLQPRTWTFRTAPEPGQWPESGELSFAFMSDSRSGAGGGAESVQGTNRRMLRNLLSQAEMSGVDFICFGGDLINGYTADPESYRRQLDSWKKAAECVGPRIPIYEGMGNHEMLADFFPGEKHSGHGMPPYRDRKGAENSESLFAEAFVNPLNAPATPGRDHPPFRENVYSFDYGPLHVVALNNTYDVSSHPDSLGGYREGELPEEELAWLDRDLEDARKRGLSEFFVFAHEPAFPCGGHAGDGMYWNGRIPEMLEMRARFWDILMRHEVRIVFFGDEHNFSLLRVDERLGEQYRTPVWHVVSGGVGAPFYARDKSLPWADKLSAFSTIQHFCRIRLDSDGLSIEARDMRGRILHQETLRKR